MYGREPEALESAAEIFDMVLAGYDIASVQAAFVAHLKASPEMPTPADIVAQIEATRPKEAPDWTRGMRNFTQERLAAERDRP